MITLSISQLQYLKAVADTGHMTRAAEECHVSQPALSMQIKKLEDELGLILIDRSRQPMLLTEAGWEVLGSAKVIMGELSSLEDRLSRFRDTVTGSLHIAVIPTLAPYLLPLFVSSFAAAYPDLELKVSEMKTADVHHALAKDRIDVGIIATLPDNPYEKQIPLFDESFVAYVRQKGGAAEPSHELTVEQLLDYRLWVLEEGNCFRDQTFDLCGMAQLGYREGHFSYEGGNIETLMRMVDSEGGATLVPSLSLGYMADEQKKYIRQIKNTEKAQRTVRLVFARSHAKKTLLGLLEKHIKQRMQGSPYIVLY